MHRPTSSRADPRSVAVSGRVRLGAVLLGGCALTLVLGALLWLARLELVNGIGKPFAERLLADLGGQLTIGRVSGSLVGDIVLDDVELEWPLRSEGLQAGAAGAAQGRLVLTGARLRAELRPAALLRGRLLEGLERIELEGGELTVVLARQGDHQSPPPGAFLPRELPAALPACRVALDALAVVLADGSRIDARDLRCSLGARRAAQPSAMVLSARGGSCALQGLGLVRGALELRGQLLADGLEIEQLWVHDSAADSAAEQQPARVLLAHGLFGRLVPDAEGAALAFGGELALGGGDVVLEGRFRDLPRLVEGFVYIDDVDPRLGGWARGIGFCGADLGLGGRVRSAFAEGFWRPQENQVELMLDWLEPAYGGYACQRLELAGELSTEGFAGASLRLHDTQGQLEVSGAQASFGAQGIDLQSMRGDITLETGRIDYYVAGVEPTEGPHEFVLAARVEGTHIEVSEARLSLRDVETDESDQVELRSGSLAWDPEDWRASVLELDLAVNLTEHLSANLGGQSVEDIFDGELRGAIQLSGPLGGLAGSADLLGDGVRFLGRDIGHVELDARLAGSSVTIERGTISGGLGDLDLSGRLDWVARNFEDLRLEAELRDLGAIGWSVLEAGRLRVSAAISGSLGNPRGDLSLRGSELVLAGESLSEVRLEAGGVYPEFDVEEFSVASRYGRLSVVGALSLSAEAGVEGGTLLAEQLVLARGSAALALEAPASLSLAGSSWRVEPLELVGSAGRATLSGSSTDAEPGGWSVDAEFSELLLSEYDVPEFGFDLRSADGRLSVDWGAHPTASAQIDLGGLGIAGDARRFDLSLSAEAGGGRLVIEQLSASGPDDVAFEAHVRAPFDLAHPAQLPEVSGVDDAVEIRLHASTPGVAPVIESWTDFVVPGYQIRGPLELDVELAGTWERLAGSARATSEALTIASDAEPLEGNGANGRARSSIGPARLEISVEAGDQFTSHVRYSNREQGATDATGSSFLLEVGAHFAAPLNLRQLIESGVPRDAEMVLDVDLDIPELGDWQILSRGKRLAGHVAAQFDLQGTLEDYTSVGLLELRGVTSRYLAGSPPIQDLTGSVRWTPQGVEIDSLEGELGAAPFTLRGAVRLDGDEPEFNLSLAGQGLLVRRQAGLLLRADVDELRLSGPLSGMRLGGRVMLVSSQYTRMFDPLASLTRSRSSGSQSTARGFHFNFARSGPVAKLRLDIGIGSREPVMLNTNLVSGSVRPSLFLRGTGEAPLLEGRVYIDPTTISIPSGALSVEAGTLDFGVDDPFIPSINARAQSRIAGYNVNVEFTGPYDRPEIILSSQPPLRDDDLLVLFLTGQLPADSLSSQSQDAALTVAVYLAVDFVQRWFSSDGRAGEESIASRIEVASGVDPARTGVQTYQVRFRTKGTAAGSSAQYLTAERDAYEKINAGYRFTVRFR